MYVFPPCELQCVSGPLKISSSRCSIGLIYQTLEATSRQSQLLPTSSLGNFDTFASRKPAPGFGRRSLPRAGVSSHLRLITELLMSLWHRDWLMTLTGQFQARRQQQDPWMWSGLGRARAGGTRSLLWPDQREPIDDGGSVPPTALLQC